MPRHSKNSTANPIYTYHEKKIDSKFSGYGTTSLRLGKDSIKVCLISEHWLALPIF